MAHKSLVPKQRTLCEQESQTTFEGWRESMIFHVSLNNKSARFLTTGDLNTWTAAEDRGFTDDDAEHNADTKMNKAAKAALLNIVLGSIASYAPVISHRFVKHQCSSLESIWDRLRSYYGLRKTGSRILEMFELKQDVNESREALWERTYSFMEDHLLTKTGGIKHEGVQVENDEVFSPTLQNVMVTSWLHTINPALPSLVRLRFSTQLRSNTVMSLREEISDAIPIMLAEKDDGEGAVCRSGVYQNGKNNEERSYSSNYNANKQQCCLCEAAGRPPIGHFLSACPYLPPDDKRYISHRREVTVKSDEYVSGGESTTRRVKVVAKHCASVEPEKILSRGVDVISSLVMLVEVKKKSSRWTLDSGAMFNMISLEECKRLNLDIYPTSQRCTQADGITPLPTLGKTHFSAIKGHHTMKFSGLVVKQLDSPVLAGMPFLRLNKVSVDYGDDTVTIDKCCTFKPNLIKSTDQSAVLRVSNQACILPGDSTSFQLPETFCKDIPVAIEPTITVPANLSEVTVSDIQSGEYRAPITIGSSWIKAQQSCPDLSKVFKYLSTGASIPKKRHMTDVRRYISCGVTISNNHPSKLLVIRQLIPFKTTTERIVIPQEISDSLLMALHIKLNHPSVHQLKLAFCRRFFCIGLDAVARRSVAGCHTCAALKDVPTCFHQQSNGKIRSNKLSAFEVWTTREMKTGNQLTFDKHLIDQKQSLRLGHHEAAANGRERGKEKSILPKVEEGEVIYLYSDRSKLRSRDKFIITEVGVNDVFVQKFAGSQFRGRVYKVKRSDIITAETIPVTQQKPPDHMVSKKTELSTPHTHMRFQASVGSSDMLDTSCDEESSSDDDHVAPVLPMYEVSADVDAEVSASGEERNVSYSGSSHMEEGEAHEEVLHGPDGDPPPSTNRSRREWKKPKYLLDDPVTVVKLI